MGILLDDFFPLLIEYFITIQTKIKAIKPQKKKA